MTRVPSHAVRPRRAPAPEETTPGRVTPTSALTVLQRQVGNRVVASLVRSATTPGDRQPTGGAGRAAADGPTIQRSATMDLAAWNAGAPAGQTYTFGVDAMTNDVVGHAWIHLKENGGKARATTIGFWPTGWGVLPTGGPGRLMSPDPHTGEQGHRSNDVIDRAAFLRVLNVVNAWEGSWYQLLYRNCAHFAKAASAAADKYTLSDAVETDGPTIWTPGEEGEVIDAANRARGRDTQGEPLPTH